MMEIEEMMFKIQERHGQNALKRHAQWFWDKIKETKK